ncbi:MAG: PAQR family membrane homeostasis protein TrhA, partial [Candidatus Geothermincolia bacterium]
ALRADALTVVSFAIYGATMLSLYTASAFYHGLDGPHKHVFRLVDHSCIFLLIAGTYTPICLLGLRGAWGWSLFGVSWAIAGGGILLNLFFLGRKWFDRASVGLYVALGWLVVVAVKPMLATLPSGMLAWIAAGGMAYTLGVVFYAWRKPRYNHAVWHLFVMGGSASMFIAILLYLLP